MESVWYYITLKFQLEGKNIIFWSVFPTKKSFHCQKTVVRLFHYKSSSISEVINRKEILVS